MKLTFAKAVNLAVALAALCMVMPALAQTVAIDTEFDEATAVLDLFDALNSGREPTAGEWSALWNATAYLRLIEREKSFGLDEAFPGKLEAWIRNPQNYSRVDEFRQALDELRHIDAQNAGMRAGAYLPAGTRLQATYYAVIKHTPNSFVFDLSGDPAIFLSVDPDRSAEYVASTLAHELHHIGMAQCPDVPDYAELDSQQQWVVDVLSMFGEGLAMLATAGGPDTHPHFFTPAAEWMAWERDVMNVSSELHRAEAFFFDALKGEARKEQLRKTLFTFFNTADIPQGGAYTLGWKMTAVIERRYGKAALVDRVCDFRKILELYNQAAEEAGLPMWSPDLLASFYPDSNGAGE